MKKIILLSFLTIGIISCSSDNNTTTSGIKMLKIISKDYSGGVQQNERTTTYTYENDLVSKVITTSLNSSVIESTELTYQNGKLKQIYGYLSSASTGISSPSITIYSYTGDLITSSTFSENGKNSSETYTYNSSNQLINRKNFKSDGTLDRDTNFEYFADGNLRKRTVTTIPNNFEVLYDSYDNKKNPMELIFTSAYIRSTPISQNNLTAYKNIIYEYEYNSNNYPTKSILKVGTEIRNIATVEYN